MPVLPFSEKVVADRTVTVHSPLAAVLPSTPEILTRSPVLSRCVPAVITIGPAFVAAVTGSAYRRAVAFDVLLRFQLAGKFAFARIRFGNWATMRSLVLCWIPTEGTDGRPPSPVGMMLPSNGQQPTLNMAPTAPLGSRRTGRG